MDRPTRTLARWLLLAAALTCMVGMVGPFQGVEKVLIPWDKAAHFIAFYGVTLLMFASFPDRRRFDLTTLAVFAGAGIEVLQLLGGRDAELGDVLADAAGAIAVYAPVYLDWLRKPGAERRARALLDGAWSGPADVEPVSGREAL